MIRAILAVILLSSSQIAGTQVQKDLFEENTPLDMTIVAPLQAIQEDRSLEDAAYRNVWVLLNGISGQDSLHAELSVRGNFRRQPQNCEWPPLKLKVKKRDVGSPHLGWHRKFKLVTNCQGENYLLREYMVYKMYQKLSPHSFKVRLVNLTIRDAQGTTADTRQLGFLIESKSELAQRLELRREENFATGPETLDSREKARLYLFQYMIGNRDWDMSMEKNIAVFYGESRPHAIPFDFDFSGCVDVPYSGLEGYELRYWRKICWDSTLQEEMRNEFRTLIPQWEQMMESCDQLMNADKKAMLKYFRPVFKAANNPDQWAKMFPAVCE